MAKQGAIEIGGRNLTFVVEYCFQSLEMASKSHFCAKK